MKSTTTWYAAAVLASLLATGCGSSSNQTQAQLEQTQKELEETKKQLEAAKTQAGQSAEQVAQTPPQGAAPLAPTAPAPSRPRTTTDLGSRTPAATSPAPAASTPAASAPAAAAPATPARRVVTIPAGTSIRVRTVTALSSKTAEAGTPFEATLAEPIVVDGETVAKRGATVNGVVTNSDPGGRVKGVATLSLDLRDIVIDGQRVKINTSPVVQEAKGSVKRDAAKVGIASGVGAAIGAIAGGGKGAAIGAGVGAGAGTGAVLATRGASAEVPSESLLTFRLAEAVRVP